MAAPSINNIARAANLYYHRYIKFINRINIFYSNHVTILKWISDGMSFENHTKQVNQTEHSSDNNK